MVDNKREIFISFFYFRIQKRPRDEPVWSNPFKSPTEIGKSIVKRRLQPEG